MLELGFDNVQNLPFGCKVSALNTLPWARRDIVKLPTSPEGYGIASGDGVGPLEIQEVNSRNSVYRKKTVSITQLKPNLYELSNDQFIVRVQDGSITSLYDIAADRELVPMGQRAAQLVIFDDKPLYWQAWDVEVYHLNSRVELAPQKVSITEDSYARVSLTIETKISDKSWVKTILSLPASIGDAPTAIEISAEIEWHETMKFLKVEFPVDIVNTEASYETQFGIVRRPTHYNTNWDMAKFEVCVHKWADLSEATYGVSILNDSKYGFATQGNVMRLSLLRAPKAPDAHADMGRHTTRYAIFPHKGGLDERTVRKAFEFNNPLKLVGHKPGTTIDSSLLQTFHIHDAPNLIIDTIKRGEDDEDVSRGELPLRKGHSIILRIYDALGGKNRGFLTWSDAVKVRKVVKTNALEDEIEDLKGLGELHDMENGGKKKGITVEVRAFEIVTLKLVMED